MNCKHMIHVMQAKKFTKNKLEFKDQTYLFTSLARRFTIFPLVHFATEEWLNFKAYKHMRYF